MLPGDAPGGLCPECLLREGLDSASASKTPTVVTGRFEPPSPQQLADYFPQLEVLELLGRGGMGAVYKVRQPALDRVVALKVLPPEVGKDPAFAERFAREARALARLSHQNIVAVYDFGRATAPSPRPSPPKAGEEEDGELYYFVMEYVDGVNLRQLIAEGKLAPQDALAIVPQICEALQFAHEEGIVHRDVKPENILVDKRGRVKIADFGLAKLLRVQPTDVTLTQAKQVMGTWHYMAPEQMERPQEVDHRADIYSLGVVFYEMLTGQLPLGRFEPPSKRAQVDARLDEVVLRALEREPERRYQFASEVKTDVETITAGSAAGLVSLARTEDAKRDLVRKRVYNPATGLLIAGIFYWGMIPLAFLLFGSRVISMEEIRSGLWWSFFMQPALAGALLIFAGAKMRRLEAYPVAVCGAIVPVVILLGNVTQFLVLRSFGFSPGDLVGPIWGIWALIVLTDPQVRSAFESESAAARAREANTDPKAIVAQGDAVFLERMNVGIMLALLALTALGMWVTQSAWILLALALPWGVAGIAAADKRQDAPSSWVFAWGLGIALAGTFGLLAGGIWLTQSGWALLAVAVPFVAMGIGYEMGSYEEKQKAAGEAAAEKGSTDGAEEGEEQVEEGEGEDEEEWGWGCLIFPVMFFVGIPLFKFIAAAVSDLNGFLLHHFSLDSRLERPLLGVLWTVLVGGLAYAAYQLYELTRDSDAGETMGSGDESGPPTRSSGDGDGRKRLAKIGGALFPIVLIIVLVLSAPSFRNAGKNAGTQVAAPAGPQAAQLLQAATDGDLAKIRELLAEYADVNATDPESGETPLMKAAAGGHTAAAVVLLMRRANEQARDKQRMTPLMHAAASGQAELVQFLVDINRVSWDEELQFRVTRLDTELPSDTDFKALHFDVAAAAQDREGETALMKAAACGDAESATALLGSASNEEARDRKGRTALMHALARKQAAFLQAMIEGAETALRHTPPGYTVTGFVTPEVLCAVDEVGKTALDLARAQGDAQIAAGLQAYLEHVIELETRGIESGSPYAGYCYQVRGLARKALGQTVEAEADLAKSRELSKPGP